MLSFVNVSSSSGFISFYNWTFHNNVQYLQPFHFLLVCIVTWDIQNYINVLFASSIIFNRRLDNAILKPNFHKSRNFIILSRVLFSIPQNLIYCNIFNASKKGKLISVTKRYFPFRNKIRNYIRKIQTG